MHMTDQYISNRKLKINILYLLRNAGIFYDATSVHPTKNQSNHD